MWPSLARGPVTQGKALTAPKSHMPAFLLILFRSNHISSFHLMHSLPRDGDNDALSIRSEASDSQAENYSESDQDGSDQDEGHQEQDYEYCAVVGKVPHGTCVTLYLQEQDYDEPVSAQVDLAGQGQGGAISLHQPCRDYSRNLPRAAWTYIYMLGPSWGSWPSWRPTLWSLSPSPSTTSSTTRPGRPGR